MTGTSDSARVREAIAFLREAARIYEAARLEPQLGRALTGIGYDYARLGRRDSALVYHGRALALSQESGDRAREGLSLYAIGRVHEDLGRPDSAIVYFRRVLTLSQDTHDRNRQGQTLADVGRVYRAMARLDSAIAYFDRSRAVYQQLGRRAEQAYAIGNIAALHGTMGRPDSALVYLQLALGLQRELGNKPAEASVLTQISALHRSQGRLDSALAYNARARALGRTTGYQVGERTSRAGDAAIQRVLGRPDSSASAASTQDQDIDSVESYWTRELVAQHGQGNAAREAVALIYLGGVQSRRGHMDSAFVLRRKALTIERELGNHAAAARSLEVLGDLYIARNRADSAFHSFGLALAMWRETNDREGEARLLLGIAGRYDRLGEADSSMLYRMRAVSVRRAMGDRAAEASLLVSIASELLKSADTSGARRAAATYDSAAALYAGIRRNAGGDANAVSFSETSRFAFDGWSAAWQQIAARAGAAGDRVALRRAVHASLGAIERGRAQALRDLLEQDRPRGAGLSEASDTVPGADLAREMDGLLAPLRASRTAMLYYHTTGDIVRTWFLGADGELHLLAPTRWKGAIGDQVGVLRRQIGVDDATLRLRRGDPAAPATADTARGLVAGVGSASDAGAAGLREFSKSVLAAGLDRLLAPGTELVIVPHGALGQLPFAALTLPGDSLPLGIRNPLRYAPSLRALRAAPSTRVARRSALVVGNPTMPMARDERGGAHQLAALPGAEAEARWVADRLGAKALTGTAATESVVRRGIGTAAIVHLATHGLAYGTESRVRDSYVALAPDSGQDGLLTLGELLDDDALRLSADLIVLSACQTGLGETRQAEGTVGLQRGLLAKGARSVVVSLWSVDDAATMLLMERFYTHWLAPGGSALVTKAEALQRAQRDVRSHPRYQHPKYWAAFQLVGAP